MKRTVIAALLAVFAALSFSSCVRDEEPVFDESASVRLQNALKNAQTVLVGAENGWRMFYYPDPDQAYGGYLYTMKFTQEDVEVWSDLFEGSVKSLYKMTTDSGPVLSFDTGNFNFHYFATPSGSQKNLYGESDRYQARKGDFEFLIISSSPDEVVLKGKRSGNKIVMRPLSGSETPESVAQAAASCGGSVFVSSFNGTIGSDDAYVSLKLGSRTAVLELTGEQYAEDETASAKVPYLYTENGLLFYNPVTLGPYTINGFTWDVDTRKLTALSGDAANVDLVGSLPPGWHDYADFLGNWTIKYGTGGASSFSGITIKEDVYRESVIISGLSKVFDMKATYDLGSGQINLCSQAIGTQGSYTVFACAWDTAVGSLTWDTNAGMFGQLSDDGNTITWSDNGGYSGLSINAFITWYLNGTSSAGQAAAPWVWSNNSTQLARWNSFVRQ
ncbi:MAG: DUF4302 domain-containing protein [Bacteroidales bacterium]|nr:DUF4302 domain-containing protein [Bacteroidales bacterium]